LSDHERAETDQQDRCEHQPYAHRSLQANDSDEYT
jgi:hypothetical protein